MMNNTSKRCVKGKSCSATCITREHTCRVNLSSEISQQLTKYSTAAELSQMNREMMEQEKQEAKERLARHLGILEKEKLTYLKGLVDDPHSVNWKAVLDPDAEHIGSGVFGSFDKVPAEKLSKDLPKGMKVGVKTGKLGESEVALLKLAGENDLGPKVIASRVSSTGKRAMGQVAMEIVPGKTMMDAPAVNGGIRKVDSYWKARAELHSKGISHGDAHDGNVIIDSKGKARFVDFGSSKLSNREAFREALAGALGKDVAVLFLGMGNGAERPGVEKSAVWTQIKKNSVFVKIDIIQKYGLPAWYSISKDDIIPKEINDNEAKKLISALYKGVL